MVGVNRGWLVFTQSSGCCEFKGACNVVGRYLGDSFMLLRSSLSYESRRNNTGRTQVQEWSLCASL